MGSPERIARFFHIFSIAVKKEQEFPCCYARHGYGTPF